MSKLLAALGLSTALMASAALPLAGAADAAMAYGGLGADVQQRQIAPIEKAQFFFGGYNYGSSSVTLGAVIFWQECWSCGHGSEDVFGMGQPGG